VNANLNFTATRTDNGEFLCSISNTESQTETTFKLNVKCNYFKKKETENKIIILVKCFIKCKDAPSAKINNSLHIVSRGDRAQIFCVLDGNPLQASHVTWKLNNKQTLGNDDYYNVRFIPPNLSVLTILNTRDVDDGEISCHVSNNIGAPNVSTTELRVKRTPQIMVDSSVLKAGEDSNIGRSALFKCQAKAYPDASFKWKKSENVEIMNGTKYTITSSKSDSQTFVSTLTVHSVVSIDYGTYLCEARNDIGSTLAKALLSGKRMFYDQINKNIMCKIIYKFKLFFFISLDQPEQPSDFRVLNITKNTIALGWKKNFNGGEQQKFLIRYRKDTLDPTYKYVETEIVLNILALFKEIILDTRVFKY
jgi:hypothetical protein